MSDWMTNIVERQPALTEKDRLLRDRFVDEYLLDRNAEKAIIRLGYVKSYAEHMAAQFMLDSYVLRCIEERKQTLDTTDKERLKSWVTSELMSRAQSESDSGTSRVMALKVLIDLHGLQPEPSKKDDDFIEGEVVEGGDLSSLNEEQLKALCEERGLPLSIFQ